MRWHPDEYLEADTITSDLESLQQRIENASLEGGIPDVLSQLRATWESAPAAERQGLFHQAKALALERHVTEIRATLDHETCLLCKRVFPFYWKCRDNAPVLRRKPVVCPGCLKAGKYYAVWQKRLRQALEQNPMAGHYLRDQLAPPRPAQYETVMNWTEYRGEDLDYHSLGLVLVGDSFTGKTSACYHLAYHLLAHQEYEDFLAVNSADLNSIPEKALDRTLGEFMDRLYQVNLLLIDDLDKVRITPRVASELWNLFEVRFREYDGPVLITMNTRTKQDFIGLFSGKDGDHRQIGLSIYNRLKKFCQFIDFDVETQPVDRRPWLEKRSTAKNHEPPKAADVEVPAQ